MNNKPNILAVDGDIIAYRIAAVAEEDFEGACKELLDNQLVNIATKSKVSDMRIYISDDFNFRHKIAVTRPYKGNRINIKRPRFLEFCKSYLINEYKAIKVANYEADDAIATDMVVTGSAHCGIDKDIKQILGHHYNYVEDIWEYVSPDQACINLYRQILMGDSSDNIPGLPRVGIKTAEKIIYQAHTALEDAIDCYEEVCAVKMLDVDPKEYMLEQTRLVSLITEVQLDFKNNIIISPLDIDHGFKSQKRHIDI